MHLTIDGYGCDPSYLSSEGRIRSFLEEYPKKISMSPISEPHVVTFKSEVEDDWGVSGFVLIAESHISVHTFPERRYVNVDIFSCKFFDVDLAQAEVLNVFGMENAVTNLLERGIEYLSTDDAEDGMLGERSAAASKGKSIKCNDAG